MSRNSFLFVLALMAYTAQAGHQRTQYHEQGLHGHDSYKFGYHTGDNHNPQSRHEERDGHGNVKGHFSYVDAHGKHHTVHYHADKNGFHRSDDPAAQHGHKHHHHAPDHGHKHEHHKHHHKHHEHGHHWKGKAAAAAAASAARA